jgi:hypothetical protein
VRPLGRTLAWATLGGLLFLAGLAAGQSVTGSLTGSSNIELHASHGGTGGGTISLTNLRSESLNVRVELSASSLTPSPTSQTIVLGPAGQSNGTATASFAVQAPSWLSEGTSYTVAGTWSATNATGASKGSGNLVSATFQVRRPVVLEVSLQGNSDQLAQGQTHPFNLMGSSQFGWGPISGIGVSSAACQHEAGPWAISVDPIQGTVVSSSTPTRLGTVRLTIPPDLHAPTFGHRTFPCSVSLNSNARDGTHPAHMSVNPFVPAWVEVVGWDPQPRFLFDRPKDTTPPFQQATNLTLVNHGETEATGTLDLTTPQGTRITGGRVELPGASHRPRVTVPATLALPSSHDEGEFALSALSGSHPVRGIARGLVYAVHHDARVVLDGPATIDLGKAPVGRTTPPARVILREALGYADVPLTVAVAPRDGDTSYGPTVPSSLVVPAGQRAPIDLTLKPPPWAAPGCARTWGITWTPPSNRPSLAPAALEVKAFIELSFLDEATATVRRLHLTDPAPVEALLGRVKDADPARAGSCAGSDDVGAAGRTIQAALALDRARTLLAGGPDDLFQAALEVATADRLTTPANHPALQSLGQGVSKTRGDLEEALTTHGERLARPGTSDAVVDDLWSISSALATIRSEREPSIKAIALAKERALKDDRRQGLNDLAYLFNASAEVPQGVVLAVGVAVNPNPLDWMAIDGIAVRADRSGERAAQALRGTGPMEQKVAELRIQTQDAVDAGRSALLLGAIVNAALAVLFVALGLRSLGEYTRDLEDQALGADILG